MTTNRFYNKSSFPVPHSQVASPPAAQELTSIESGFLGVQNELDAAIVNAIGAVGFKNFLINGRMKVAQRQATKAGIGPTAGAYYTADMWRIDMNATSLVLTNTTGIGHPVLGSNGWIFQVQVTTAEASVSALEHCTIMQRVEAGNCYDLRGRSATLQFWVKSPKAGIHCVAFRTNPALVVKTQIKEFTVLQADTWEKKVINITFDTALVTSGALVGLDVIFTLMAGATYQVAPDVWQNGNYLASTNQQNLCDTIGNVFAITDIQLELGNTATDIEARSLGLEIQLCERFFEKGYTYNVYPGTAYNSGTGTFQGSGASGGPIVISNQFSTRKAIVPTMTFYDAAGTASKLTKYDGGWSDGVDFVFTGNTDKGWMVGASPGGGATLLDCQWTAEVNW